MANTNRNCLVLTQSRESSEYNDFVGRFYHFPEKYAGQFKELPAEFIYYESTKTGDGVYFGYGKIKSVPTPDKREAGHHFVEVTDYKPFLEPVSFKDAAGKIRESDSPHYNAQNAVRKISSQLLDEICLDGKVRLNFTADAHLIKVLGEQLIASEKVGILELIKNAYDAGASYCRVKIEDIPGMLPPMGGEEYSFPDLPGPVIIIEDDGSGMTRDVIENGWLRPASTIKTAVKDTIRVEREKAALAGTLGAYDKIIAEIKKERGGRIPLGEKGVGRFASHRLGRQLRLKTKVKELDYEYVLDVDWDNFDSKDGDVKDLATVGISLYRQAPSRDYGEKGSGTQMVIYGGREGFTWNPETILELNHSISGLNSPNPSPKNKKIDTGFRASLECPQVGILLTEDPAAPFTPIFSFDGIIDEEGQLEYSLKFQPPNGVPMPAEEVTEKKFDLRKADKDYWKDSGSEGFRKSASGAFYLHVDVWYRTGPWVTGPDAKSFTEHLDSFGGISIFRDGINVFPAEWGAETDWLNLSTRHIKKGQHLSYYNMIGNLELNQADNIDLIDKTNREGLIKNRAFNDLVKLTQVILLNIIETSFMGKRDEYVKLTGGLPRDPEAIKNYVKAGSALMGEIKDNYPLEEDPYKILGPLGKPDERAENLVNLSGSLKNLQKSLDLMKEAQDLLTEQAGYGMAVAVSVHEIAKIAANFYSGVSHLLKSATPDMEKLKNLKDASASLQSELKRLSPLRAVKTENRSEFGVGKPVSYVVEVFRSKLEKAGIEVEVNAKESFDLFGRYGALIQIFSNLFDNSVYWLETVPRKNRKIKVHINKDERTVIIADSGPGIDEVIMPYLFQPGYSLRIPPSGLGLYICKHYMQSMKGDAYLTPDRERIKDMPGAQFTLDFSRVAAERILGEKK